MAINKDVYSGASRGPGPNGEIIGGFDSQGLKTSKPIVFLGGTVTSFSCQLGIGPNEESSLTVQLVNDCKSNTDVDGNQIPLVDPDGDHFLGNVKIGSPVFFDMGEYTTYEPTRQQYVNSVLAGQQYFNFGGILQSFTANQSSSGLTFSARIVDPRFLLNGFQIVVSDNLTGPIKHRNYYNVYAHFEYFILPPESRTTIDQAFPKLTTPNTDNSGVTDDPRPPNATFGDNDPRKGILPDCGVLGSAMSNENGMLYHKIIQGLREMSAPGMKGPLVYSPNYGEQYFPPLKGRDAIFVNAERSQTHDLNIFQFDLNSMPAAPEYFRIPGPSTNLLDIINSVCEATGKIFHIAVEPDPRPGKPLIIKVYTQDVLKALNAQWADLDGFKSTIMRYNGKATDLEYGKELGSDNTRTLLIGEKKHQMLQTVQILPFLGEDKFGRAILPDTNQTEADPENVAKGFDCGFKFRIYLDELQDILRCPLYDYDGAELLPANRYGLGPNAVLHPNRRVEIREFHLRAAMSSFEVWKKYVFHPYNQEDFSRIIRRNFPDYSFLAIGEIATQMARTRELTEQERENGENGPAPEDVEFVEDAPQQAVVDNMNNFNAQALNFLQKRQTHEIEKLYNWLSAYARTYYGKQYAAIIQKSMCVKEASEVDYSILKDAGIEDDGDSNTVTYVDPCTGQKSTVVDSIWQPRVYTHLPTNDGAWIENCGSVLGLGGRDLGETYLAHFRTEDGRVGAMARFDSKLQTLLNTTETMTDDSQTQGNTGQRNGAYEPNSDYNAWSNVAGVLPPINLRPGPIDPQDLKMIRATCGGLNTKDWPFDDYLTLIPIPDEQGPVMCPPPVSGIENRKLFLDLPQAIWTKCTVGDKLYLDSYAWDTDQSGGCRKLLIKERGIRRKPNADPCCGLWQTNNATHPCYWNELTRGPLPIELIEEECYETIEGEDREIELCEYVLVPFSFDNGCFSRYCDDQNQYEILLSQFESLQLTAGGFNWYNPQGEAKPLTFDVDKGAFVDQDGTPLQGVPSFCYTPQPTGIMSAMAALDSSSANNQKIHPSLVIPTAAALPFVSNLETYGPWKSQGFDFSSGGVEVIQDTDFNPWLFSSAHRMDQFAKKYVRERNYNKTEIETGSIRIPGFPDIPLGFMENGPNLTNINVQVGANGVTSTYNFRTFTPKFGGLKDMQKKAITSNASNIHRIRNIARRKNTTRALIRAKTGQKLAPELNPPLTDQGTLTRLLIGTNKPFSVVTGQNKKTSSEIKPVSTGDRTVVGGETLQKSITELRYDYRKKAFMSLDGVFSPIADNRPYYIEYESVDVRGNPITLTQENVDPDAFISQPDGVDENGDPKFKKIPAKPSHDLATYAKYHNANREWDFAFNRPQSFSASGRFPSWQYTNPPIPPIDYFPLDQYSDIPRPYRVNDIRIDATHLFPLQPNRPDNPSLYPHHIGPSAGHNIDIVGRGIEAPNHGVINNFYGQSRWEERYSEHNRFLGLRGPLVLHQWGYDTNGKPIPNLIDDEELIKKRGIFRTVNPFPSGSDIYPGFTGTCSGIDPVTGSGYTEGVGLTDHFMRDWLIKPQAWPVGPVDLRWDRKRGVWVSPPQYKMVAVEAIESVPAYGSGQAILINNQNNVDYGEPIYDSNGKIIKNNESLIRLEDRIGAEITSGQKGYAFFDSFSSTYLLMGGGAGSEILIGKFCNQWPSLSNVKDPQNAVKEVALYTLQGGCVDSITGKPISCPWNLQPVMKNINGVAKPVVVEVLNLFSNVAAAEYETKWCAILSKNGAYYLLAAEC